MTVILLIGNGYWKFPKAIEASIFHPVVEGNATTTCVSSIWRHHEQINVLGQILSSDKLTDTNA